MVNCKICEQSFEDDSKLHRHLKSHNILVQEYYFQYFPRYDLLTKQRIPYKNKEQYFGTDFLSKDNFIKWMQSQPLETQKTYCQNLLETRKEKKGLIYAPTQVELRSICSPSIITLTKLFGEYGAFAASLGFINKFIYIEENHTFNSPPQGVKITIDTREQNPLLLPYETESKKLDYGDYAFSDLGLCNNVAIERKSLADAISTFTTHLERFEKELVRAKTANGFLVVLVEESLTNCLNYLKLKLVDRHIRIPPEVVFHNIRNLLQKYDNLQFLFVKNRKEAGQHVLKILSNADFCKKHDLQYLYDLQKL